MDAINVDNLSEQDYEDIGATVIKMLRKRRKRGQGWSRPRVETTVGTYTDIGIGKLIIRIAQEISSGRPRTKI